MLSEPRVNSGHPLSFHKPIFKAASVWSAPSRTWGLSLPGTLEFLLCCHHWLCEIQSCLSLAAALGHWLVLPLSWGLYLTPYRAWDRRAGWCTGIKPGRMPGRVHIYLQWLLQWVFLNQDSSLAFLGKFYQSYKVASLSPTCRWKIRSSEFKVSAWYQHPAWISSPRVSPPHTSTYHPVHTSQPS